MRDDRLRGPFYFYFCVILIAQRNKPIGGAFFVGSCCPHASHDAYIRIVWRIFFLALHQIVSVEGELSEISETSCGTSIFAVGSTIYELSGAADLESRGLGVLDMFSDACVTADTPSTADCYTCVRYTAAAP